VLAGLLLSGCGGDSSQGASTTSPTAAAPGDGGAAPGEAGSEKEGTAAPGEAGGEVRAAAPKEASAPASEPTAKATKKHGATIAQPKGPREQTPTPAEVADLTVADMSLSSPSLPPGPGGPVPLTAAYTCDGEGKWPDLSWSGVPAGSAELILYAMNVQPVAGKLFVDWAVAGLDPGLSGIEAGKLPKGAVVGTNSFGKRGYEICPESSEIYIFAVYALPRALSSQPGFDARELRRQVLDVSGNVGLLSATYTRG